MELKPGLRLRSAVSDAEIIVIRAPAGDVDLQCGGHPMVPLDAAAPADGTATDDGPLIGKRYADADAGIEVLCTKAGNGRLTVGDEVLPPKEAAPLPSSD